jgi:hypothetical protein
VVAVGAVDTVVVVAIVVSDAVVVVVDVAVTAAGAGPVVPGIVDPS